MARFRLADLAPARRPTEDDAQDRQGDPLHVRNGLRVRPPVGRPVDGLAPELLAVAKVDLEDDLVAHVGRLRPELDPAGGREDLRTGRQDVGRDVDRL
eukprot:2307667-Alexandrium_andersonii.AAC.1